MGSEQNDSTSVPFSEPKLCANNCGFWGNAATMNLCSKCYKDFCLKEQQAAKAKAAMEKSLMVQPIVHEDNAVAVAMPVPVPVPANSTAEIVASVASSSSEAQPAVSNELRVELKPKAANRCGSCNKKVGLTGFKCRCGMTFCGTHRYPENHSCLFDFKSVGRDAIAKANPVVKADKIERV